MIRVVVTGSECTGKTTLAQALAEHFGTQWVPEYARRFVMEKGRALTSGDVEAIARGQIELEDAVTAGGPRLVVQDTDLLSTVVYSRHYYGHCPEWIEQALDSRAPDLYLLVGIDVPWVADLEQRDRGERREEMQELFRRALIDRRLSVAELVGTREARLASAISAVEQVLLVRGQER